MSGAAEGPAGPAPRAEPDPNGLVRPTLGQLFASTTIHRRRDRAAPTPDLLELFDKQRAFIDLQYPEATPSTTGAEQLDELARVRATWLSRLVHLETADRIVAMIIRLSTSAATVAAAAVLGRHAGVW